MSEGPHHGKTGKETQEEYEDDFEKDLDWLIDEEARSVGQEHSYDDIEAEIDKELEEEEEKERELQHREGDGETNQTVMEENRPDGDGSHDPLYRTPDHEEKKYILERAEQDQHQLQDQSTPNHRHRRRLQFKDTLVDLVVPPLDYNPKSSSERDFEEADVSERMSELYITKGDRTETRPVLVREGRVLVEKDGKFDLVSLKEVESQGLLPPLSSLQSDTQTASSRQSQCCNVPSKSSACSRKVQASQRASSTSVASSGSGKLYDPKPTVRPVNRPSSAGLTLLSGQRRTAQRRAQSASSAHSRATFFLSPQQKELQLKLQHRRERLLKQEEERKRAEEEQKQHENERAFRAWLLRKRGQQLEERRLQRAQELERLSCTREHSDPNEAFKLWLQRKQEQHEKQRQLEDMKRLEEESSYCLHNRQECDTAFRLWLRRKRAEKRAEQQAAQERSRRLVMEARRARRMQDLLCSVGETRSLRLTNQYSYRF